MTELASRERTRTADNALRARAARVIPNGMYGHLSARLLPAEYPQFYDRGRGARVWDVDGNEYVDLMCSFGPMIMGYAHAGVEQAAAAQRERGDTLSGPGGVMVELAELLTSRVDHADWAMFAKNGTDATSLCLAVARAATGRDAVVMARGAYHGWAAWSNLRPIGMPAQDRANVYSYTYNDLASVQRAVDEAGAGNVAAVFVSPFRHDAGHDQELVDPAFARGLRALCDSAGAALVMDEVRAGFRLHHGGSWEPLGVRPDLSAWSKAIANGHPIGAALGSEAYRAAAGQIFATGSFWYQAVPMAAAVATITALRDSDAIAAMEKAGSCATGSPGSPPSTRSPCCRPGRCRCPTSASPATRTSPGPRCSAGPRPRTGAAAPAAQLVPVGRAYRRRHRPGPGRHRRGVPRRACAVWP